MLVMLCSIGLMTTTWTDHLKDGVEEWLERSCVKERWSSVTASELHAAFLEAKPHATVSQRALTAVLDKLGYSHVRHGTKGRVWLGLRLRPTI